VGRAHVFPWLAFALVAACGSDPDSTAPAPETPAEPCPEIAAAEPVAAPALHTPRWAFEPWISKDISNRDDTYAFVDGFRERGIPVGAVVLDSPWETSYNTFVPNPTRYGDFPGLVRDMHERNVRVVLWITSAVNERSFDFEPGGDGYNGPSPNLEEGLRCGFFIDQGDAYGWWKGRGSFVDFSDRRALTWWHRQQDDVLSLIDGWKLDFAESYIPTATVITDEGEVPRQRYSELYYEDFLSYGRSKRGRDFVTMVRAWDASYEFAGRFFARREHAPVAWMGDNRRDWVGLADALDHAFVSARAGYPVVGSDVGGYLDVDDKNVLGAKIPFDTVNFARWTAVGALSPFFQLHGRANLTPWTVPDHVDETVALYKYWSILHHALVPFLYSRSEEAWAAPGTSLVEPIGEPASWPGDYRYILGGAFLVAPILDATGVRSVPLPTGSRWYDWWSGAVSEGGATLPADFSGDRAKIPLYVKEGSIVPMNLDDPDDVLGLGGAGAKGALTVLAWPSEAGSTFALREDDDTTTTLEVRDGAQMQQVQISASAAVKPLALRVRFDSPPAAVTLDAAPLPMFATEADLVANSGAGYSYDVAKKMLIVRVPARGPGAASIVATKP
jgi:alpha-glucosidase (family GH31 glycosyl hydrolase)